MKKLSIISIIILAATCFAWTPPADKLPVVKDAIASPGMMMIGTGTSDGGTPPVEVPTATAQWKFDNNAEDNIGSLDLTNTSQTYSDSSPPEGTYYAVCTSEAGGDFTLSAASAGSLSIGSQDYTMSFWVNLTAAADYIYIAQKTDSINGYIVTIIDCSAAGTTPCIYVDHQETFESNEVEMTSALTVGAWNHVVIVYDYSENDLIYYVSTTSFGNVANGTTVEQTNPPAASTSDFTVGETGSFSYNSTGLDDVRIWVGTALSAAEAEALYDSY